MLSVKFALDSSPMGRFVLTTMKQKIKSNPQPVAEFKKRVDGDFVIYEDSKLFEVGDFPDKKFALNESEMDRAIANYKPGQAQINLEHTPTILDGRLGYVEGLRREGLDLFGSVKIPKWFDDQLPENTKVSCEWSRDTKSLDGLGIVENPRIKTAALMSAFSDANPDEAALFADDSYYTNPMQTFHDLAVKKGAECGGKSAFTDSNSDTAEFMTPAQLKQIQKIHDIASNTGADCDAYQTRKDAGMPHAAYGYNFSGKIPDNQKRTNSYMKKDTFGKLLAWFKGIDEKLPEDATTEDFANIDFSNIPEDKDNDVTPAQFAELETRATKAEKSAADAIAANTELSTKFTEVSTAFSEAQKTIKALQDTVQLISDSSASNAKTSQYNADCAEIEKLVSEFKITPAAAVKLKEVALNSPEAFSATKSAFSELKPVVHGGRDASFARAAIEGGDVEGKELNSLATAKAKADGVSFSEAFVSVCRENPELALSYRENQGVN